MFDAGRRVIVSSWTVDIIDGSVRPLTSAPSKSRPKRPPRTVDLVCVQCQRPFRGTKNRRLCGSVCQDLRLRSQVDANNRAIRDRLRATTNDLPINPKLVDGEP